MISIGRIVLTRWLQANATTWGPSFNGYRVLITTPSGKQSWILLEKPGLETFTADHLAAGTKGGQWRAKRVPKVPETLADCGYNQVSQLPCPEHRP